MNAKFSVTLQSKASRWQDLVGRIQDALFDAQHGAAGLQGAKPQLMVLLSRNLLNMRNLAAMQGLSHQLEQQGVTHSFNCVALGSAEPNAHKIMIAMD